MNIKDKQLYNLLNEFAMEYTDKLFESQEEEDLANIFFYKGKLNTIIDICMYLNVPMFDKLQEDIINNFEE